MACVGENVWASTSDRTISVYRIWDPSMVRKLTHTHIVSLALSSVPCFIASCSLLYSAFSLPPHLSISLSLNLSISVFPLLVVADPFVCVQKPMTLQSRPQQLAPTTTGGARRRADSQSSPGLSPTPADHMNQPPVLQIDSSAVTAAAAKPVSTRVVPVASSGAAAASGSDVAEPHLTGMYTLATGRKCFFCSFFLLHMSLGPSVCW